MKTLQKPKFKDLNQGNGAGSPVLKALWEKFDLSLLLTQCGMNKHSGTPAWIIVFAYVVGLTKGCFDISEEALNTYVKRWRIGVPRQGCLIPTGERPVKAKGQNLAA